MTHTDPAIGVLLSGPSLEPTNAADRNDPQGIVTVKGVTDEILLWRRTAYPTPTTADVTLQTTPYDVRTGNAETVMRAYVNANLGPGAPVPRRVAAVTLAANLNRGITVSKSARFDYLGDLLASIATVAGLGFRLVQIGTALQFQVYDPTDKSGLVRLDLDNGTLASQSVTRTAPAVTRAIVAGQGQGENRTLLEVASANTDEADYGMFGRIEVFLDQRNTDDPVELTQAGTEAILEGASGVAVKAVPGNDQTMAYPTDWAEGDIIGLVVGDQPTTAQVTGVTILINQSVGVVVGASIGDVKGWDPQAGLRKTVAKQDERLSNLERNLETGAVYATLVGAIDADTLTQPGEFYLASGANATVVNHWPLDNVAGYLEVLAGGSLVVQRYTTRATGDVRLFTRTKFGATWTGWVEVTVPLVQHATPITTALTAAAAETYTGLNVVAVTIPGRKYEVKLTARLRCSVANDRVGTRIRLGTSTGNTAIGETVAMIPVTGTDYTIEYTAYYVAVATITTFGVFSLTLGGTGTTAFVGSATAPATLSVRAA